MVKSENLCDPHLSIKRRNGGGAVCQWKHWGGLEKCWSLEPPKKYYRCANCSLWICYQCNSRYVEVHLGRNDWDDDITMVATSNSGAGGLSGASGDSGDSGQAPDPTSGLMESSPSTISMMSSSMKVEAGSIKLETVPPASVKKEKKKEKKAPITRKRMAILVDGEYYYIKAGAKVKVNGGNVIFQHVRASVALFKKPDGSFFERDSKKKVLLPKEQFSIELQLQFRTELCLEEKQRLLKKTKEILKEYGEISALDVALLPEAVAIEASFFSEASLSAFDDASCSTFVEKIRVLANLPIGSLRASTPELTITKNSLVERAKTYKCWDIRCPQRFRCLSPGTIKRHLSPGNPCFENLKQLGISYKNTVATIENLLERNFDTERVQADIVSAANVLQSCIKVDYRPNEIPERVKAAIKNSKRSNKLRFQFSLGRPQFVSWVLTKGDLWGYLPASDSFLLEFKTRVHLSEFINEFYLTAVSTFTKTQRWVEVDEKPFKVEWHQFGADFMQGTVTVKGLLNVDI